MNKLVICLAIFSALSACGGSSNQSASSTPAQAPLKVANTPAPVASVVDAAPVAQGRLPELAPAAPTPVPRPLQHLAAPAKLASATATLAPCTTNCFNKRYIYFGGNFVKAASTADTTFAKLKDVIRTGHDLGYNGIVLNPAGSGAFSTTVGNHTTSYFYDNFRELVAYAAQYNMELIPVGASPDSITTIDASLIEAVPAQNRPFVVANGVATSTGTDIAPNADFESGNNNWNLLDGITRDSTTGHLSTTSVKFDQSRNQNPMRLYREFPNLQPYTAYRMSFWIKSSDFDAPLRLQIFDGQSVNPIYNNASNALGLGTTNGNFNASGNVLAQTQDWTEYNVDFNTLGNSTIRVYLGTWSAGSHHGAAWVDDVRIKEVGLNHTVRRTSLPVLVKSENGGTTYTEGTDYVVGTEKLTIPANSSIHNGDHLSVSWAQSARGLSSTWGAPASACYPQYFSNTNSVVSNTFSTMQSNKSFFVYFDEWRVMNWDSQCGNITAGKYLENTFRGVQQGIYAQNPNADVYVWNDMFDPYHNAKPAYWMVKGDLSGGIAGLDPKTIVVNWNENGDQQVNSLKYFSDKGFKQLIALYYDDNANLDKTNRWLNNLTSAQGLGVQGVDGFVYTTWAGDNGYADLERVANLLKSTGRWPQ